MRAFSTKIVILSLLSLMACSHAQAFIVSGESLNTVGQEFLGMADYMDAAAKDGKVTKEQYDKWAAFGLKFVNAFPAAVHLWRLSVMLDDSEMRAKSVEVIMLLIPELMQIAEDVGVSLEQFK